MSLIDAIEDKIFDIHWYFTVERDAKKSMKRFSDTMDKAIATLNEAAAKIPDTDNENMQEKGSDNETGREEQTISVYNAPQQLEVQEKTAIIAVLVKLMAAKRPTDRQRDYFRILKQYLGVGELPTIVPSLQRCSQEMQKCLFQIVTEFLCAARNEEDDIAIRVTFDGDNLLASEIVFRKLRRKTSLQYEKTDGEDLSGEDVLCALQIDLEEKEAMVFKTLELFHHAGAEGILEQYSSVVGSVEPMEEISEGFPICSFEQWEKIQYELLAQDLLDSIYETDYAEESEYKEALSVLWEKLQSDFEEGKYAEADVMEQLEENGIFIDLLRKEYEIKMEIDAMIDVDPDWQENLKKEGSALCKKTEELQSVLDEGDERRYRAWIDCISREQLTEDELWEKAAKIGLIPDAGKVLRIQQTLS